jgi:DNA modification methylase
MMKHPAKYTDCLLPIFSEYLKDAVLVLDPFAGTGKLKEIVPNAILLEIEPEWASMSGAIVSDSQYMPLRDNVFDAVCTSPTYGNRMADHFVDHQPHKNYVRNTYRHCLGRSLNSNNSGRMQWGNKYKKLHIAVWKECKRVLKKDGLFILNISDHIRAGKRIYVSDWHVDVLKGIGFKLLKSIEVKTPRQKMGKNSELRVGCEYVLIFKELF